MEQRTLNIDGQIVYCYEDGSVEWYHRNNKVMYRTFGNDTPKGYKQVRINKRSYRVHRLIALAFHPRLDESLEVDHINRNKADNRPENLRWVTHSENEDNKDCVDQSIAKYGVRCKDNRKAYNHAKNALYGKAYRETHVSLNAKSPSGSNTTYHFKSVDDPVYKLLKPLSLKARYEKHQELLSEGGND